MQFDLLDNDRVPSAQRLVNRVFPHQSLSERLSFWAYTRRDWLLVRLVFKLAGIEELIGYWIATTRDSGAVMAIAGLYRYSKDADDAVWLGWFCVAPEARGSGLGSQILDYVIDRARATGKKYFRLYTSTDPNEAAAQALYEKKGFSVVRTQPGITSTIIFREKVLA